LTGDNACKEGDFVVLNHSKILGDGIADLRKLVNRTVGFYIEVIFGELTPKKDYKKGQPVTNQNHFFKMDVKGDISEYSTPSVTPSVITNPDDGLDLE
jgi:hypothetical protein